jgi:hypothetical protein
MYVFCYRSFADAKEHREQSKDSQVRLERFQRNAGRPTPVAGMGAGAAGGGGGGGATASSVSGSFGGKPKTMRNAAGKRKNMALPAWMVGSEGAGGGGGSGADDDN